MKEQFVTYEIALALNELGFNEECFGYFSTSDKIRLFINGSKSGSETKALLAPLWQQAIDWFREEKDLNLYFIPSGYFQNDKHVFRIDSNSIDIKIDSHEYSYISNYYESYYESREQAILKAIELCKNN